ncbi:MAG TPA: hypothetical protein VMB81_13305 [Candidatus Sulfotelmatobacter sp.]|nr:hypothetical protein [Candidatus Sulfotelmatobacter sp.]
MTTPALERLDTQRLAGLLGVPANEVTRAAGVSLPDLRCAFLADEDRDRAILGVLRELHKDLRVSGGDDNTVWERGWSEVLADVRRDGFALEVLRPQYYRGQVVIRLAGGYVAAETDGFLNALDLLVRRIVLRRHLADARHIVELGCGTGLNLLLAHEIAPEAALHGADWAQASVDIMAAAAPSIGRLTGSRFNMLTLEGAAALPIDGDTTVLTVHALEQLGAAVQPIIDMLLERQPRLCVHLEPLAELYDAATLFDYLALEYHNKRNYLVGFLPALERLAQSGRIEIVDRHRFGLGSQFHEGYSLIVWRPRPAPPRRAR